MIVFCLAVAASKSSTAIQLVNHAIEFVHFERKANDSLFSPRTREVAQFVKDQNLKTIFLTPKVQDDPYDFYRMTYQLWPIKNETGSEDGVILKGEASPDHYLPFLIGKEVDFVRRSP